MEGSFDLTSLHDGLEEKSVQSYARHISGAEHVLGKGSGTLKDAKINASWGCIICSAVVQCAKYCPRELPSVPDWRIEWRMQSHDARAGGDPFEFSFPTIEFCQKGERWNRGLEIFTPSDYEVPSDSPFKDLQRSSCKNIGPDPWSDNTIPTMKEWLAKCVADHPLCKTDKECDGELPLLPTRALDLGVNPESKVVHLRQFNGERSLFAALSHCWGDLSAVSSLKTTRSTVDEHMEGIKIDSLTKTFQHAVVITRKLGIRYLWIDSLCIIQDESADWEVESAKMDAVYGNAHIVLAATRAPNGNYGLLVNRPRDFHKIIVTDRNKATHTLFVREVKSDDHNIFVNPVFVEDSFPLLHRGWAFQERLLSRRIIQFCETEILWECRGATWCQCSPGNHNRLPKMEPTLKASHVQILDANAKFEEILYLWSYLIRGYTRTRLTYQSDRIVAVSSLAKQFHTQHPELGRYAAGLWEANLIDGLTWHSGSRSLRQSGDGSLSSAPTWSWASGSQWTYPGQSSTHERTCTPMAQVVDLDYLPRNPEAPFGAIIKAELTLFGLLVPASLQDSRRAVSSMQRPLEIYGVEFDYFCDDIDGHEAKSTVYCLWVQSRRYNVPSYGRSTHSEDQVALVLRKVNALREQYHRVGLIVSKDEQANLLRDSFSMAEEMVVVII